MTLDHTGSLVNPEFPLVSAVIPTHNRARVIERALRSALRQSGVSIEVVIVDDASTDETQHVVGSLHDDRLRYHRLERNLGPAVARNVGMSLARGDYVAYLDSDDEWTVNHVADAVALLREHRAQGLFGSFVLDRGGVVSPYLCKSWDPGHSMAEYILGAGRGDARTSTFVFERAALQRVSFDEQLSKHEDWDLAIRFSRSYRLLLRPEPSVTLHVEGEDRLSAGVNPTASARFLARYLPELKPKTRARVLTDLARRMRLVEGRNAEFHTYLREALSLFAAARLPDKVIMLALRAPVVDAAALAGLSLAATLRRQWRHARFKHAVTVS